MTRSAFAIIDKKDVNRENDEADHQHTSEQSPQPLSSSQSDSSPVTDQPAQQQQTDTANDPHYQRRHYRVQLAAVIVGFCVMVIYVFQLNEMRKSTNAATRVAKLTQKSLDATQEALRHASKANDISEKALEAANTPWIDASVKDVTYRITAGQDDAGDLPPAYGVLGMVDAKGNVFNKTIEISYSIQNHSGSPAPRVYAECYLEHAVGCQDREVFDSGTQAIMPNQTLKRQASLMVPQGDPRTLVDKINRAQIGIRVYVLIWNAVGKKTSFIETFYKSGGKFIVTNMEFDPPESVVKKMMDDARFEPKKHDKENAKQ